MNFIITKDPKWIQKWDEFLLNESRGSHLIYSQWLQSYASYGFDYEIFIVHEDEVIIGGYGAVIAKSFFFKFYIIPHGPIIIAGKEDKLERILSQLSIQAKKRGCCYFQYSLPISNEVAIESYGYSSKNLSGTNLIGKEGNLFKYVYSNYGINWVDFNTTISADELLQQMSVQVRRNINLSYKNAAEISFAISEEECKLAYKTIENNAKEAHYSVRAFEDFKATILELIAKERAYLLTAKIDGVIKGAGFAVNCGNHLTYISGGTKKEKPDLKLGYLLHWELIKKSYELGYKGYNISMGGSKGVMEFKAKFNTQTISFETPHRHVITKPIIFKIYLILNSIFVKNKKTISVLLKRFK